MPPTTQDSRDAKTAHASHDTVSLSILSPSTFRQFYERRYMLFVAVAGNGIFYTQAYVIFAEQKAANVSALAFSISIWALTSWLIYGLMIKDRIIIVANIVGIIGAILVLLGVALYG